MSKYDPLWEYVAKDGRDAFTLTFDEIGEIARVPLDHSFLHYKKGLQQYGYQVEKISLKQKSVLFNKISHHETDT